MEKGGGKKGKEDEGEGGRSYVAGERTRMRNERKYRREREG